MQRSVDLSALMPRFLVRLEERLRRMDAALANIAGITGEPLVTLMRDFHSLAGIAGTYGFPEITRLAREGELLIAQAIREERTIHAAEASSARLLVAQMDALRVRLPQTYS